MLLPMRNQYMTLTSGKKRAMKKVGYRNLIYKTIPLSMVHKFIKLTVAKLAHTDSM